MTDISTIIDHVTLHTCIYNAAGCWDVTPEELYELSESSSGAVVTKSSTLKPRKGNHQPRLYVTTHGSINSMGIPNLGFDFYKDFAKKITNKPYIQSIAPFSIDEMIDMLSRINEHRDNVLVEINLSCPNLKGKSIVALDFNELGKYLGALQEYCTPVGTHNLVLGLKLPPYFVPEQFDEITKLLIQTPCIKFITCCNSLCNGLMIDSDNETTQIYPKGGLGGVGGLYLKPIALANVRNFYERIGHLVSIIGCGGVATGRDVFEYILCGASAVQVGTTLIKQTPECFEILNNELMQIMKNKNYVCINDFRGKLKKNEGC